MVANLVFFVTFKVAEPSTIINHAHYNAMQSSTNGSDTKNAFKIRAIKFVYKRIPFSVEVQSLFL